jgi:hypothetical protein
MVEGGGYVARPLAAYGLIARVCPPIARRLAGRRDQPGQEHEQFDRYALADERRHEASQRLRDDDQLTAVADRLQDGVRVVPQPRRVVLAGKVGGTTSWRRACSSGSTRCQTSCCRQRRG